MKNATIVGASFSHPHLSQLGFSIENSIQEYARLGLKHIRLGCYWSIIEKNAGTYDFSEIDFLVDSCRKLGIAVIMTIGMKAPRYPEYYIPIWLVNSAQLKNNSFIFEHSVFNSALFSFIKTATKHFKNNRQIKYWQVENEPLDPSGPHWWKIDTSLLKNEVAIIKEIDSNRPIVINLWGNELKSRNYYEVATDLADTVGLDLYPKVPGKNIFGKSIMQGPRTSDIQIHEIIKAIKKKGKKVWISELQAEPWGISESCLPQQVLKNVEWIANWDIDGVFLWGFEYWYQQKKLGNPEYWASLQKAIALLSNK